MDFCSALCLICMVIIVVSTIIKICTLKRTERLKYISNFKKGKFALIYIVAIPLYFMALVYNGQSAGASFLMAIKLSVDLVVLKFDYSSVANLMAVSLIFRITMITCFILVIINAIIFTLTLFAKKLTNWFYKAKSIISSKNVNVVVGYNAQTKDIIESINSKNQSIILFAEQDATLEDYAFVKKFYFQKISKNQNIGAILKKLFHSFDKKMINVIINTGDDAQNLIFVEQLSNIINSMDLSKYLFDDAKGLNAYVFGEPENSSAFLHFVETTNGCVHYINKYKLIAMDFVGKYPLTQFMTEEQIDYNTATIKSDVVMNVAILGFGKTNQQIFLTSVANNQFMTEIGGNLKEKHVNYYIYDKKNANNDKNLNHNYFRFEKELLKDKSQYLPIPQKPAFEEFFELDINDNNFYESIKYNLSSKQCSKAFNYIIISFGTDMENLDFADKIVCKLKEWNMFNNTKIFARIRNRTLAKEVIDKEYFSNTGIITFGNDKDIVYNLSQIVGEKKEALARDRHLSYSLKDGLDEKDELQMKLKAVKKWYSQAQVQREANIYACLSIRMKLQLMGFDYCLKTEKFVDEGQTYLKKYQQGDDIIYDLNEKPIKGRKTIVYSNNFVNGSLRNTFAIQEHQRWNAYMITCGIIPSTIAQIENGDSKNLQLRRHGNITTFDGLVKFREIEANCKKCSEEETDVIRYDYQLMDDLLWLLDNHGYKIIKK